MASRGINKVILIGNLGSDPDSRTAPNGNMVTRISLATSESWQDRNTGETQERTEWHRVVFFGKLAEIAQQYLRKGSKVYVEGKLQTQKWQGQDGQDRYTTEVIVDQRGVMQMLDSRQGQGGGVADYNSGVNAPAATSAAPAPAPAANPPMASSAPKSPQADAEGFDDDIPF